MNCRLMADLAVMVDERRMGMRRGKMIAAGLAVCAVGAGITVNAYAASTTRHIDFVRSA